MLTPIAAHHAIYPQTLDNASGTSYLLDLAEHHGAKAILWLFAIGATDVAVSAMKIQESDTKTDAYTLAGTPSDVKDSTTKPGTGSDGGIFGILVPLDAARKRYQQAVFTAGNGTSGTAVQCTALILGGNSDFDAADMGLATLDIA